MAHVTLYVGCINFSTNSVLQISKSFSKDLDSNRAGLSSCIGPYTLSMGGGKSCWTGRQVAVFVRFVFSFGEWGTYLVLDFAAHPQQKYQQNEK